jgi:hypothetical protein
MLTPNELAQVLSEIGKRKTLSSKEEVARVGYAFSTFNKPELIEMTRTISNTRSSTLCVELINELMKGATKTHEGTQMVLESLQRHVQKPIPPAAVTPTISKNTIVLSPQQPKAPPPIRLISKPKSMSSSGPPNYLIGAPQRMREEIDRAAAEATKDEDFTTDTEEKEKRKDKKDKDAKKTKNTKKESKKKKEKKKRARSTSS